MRTQLTTASTNCTVFFVEPREWLADFAIVRCVDRVRKKTFTKNRVRHAVFRVSS